MRTNEEKLQMEIDVLSVDLFSNVKLMALTRRGNVMLQLDTVGALIRKLEKKNWARRKDLAEESLTVENFVRDHVQESIDLCVGVMVAHTQINVNLIMGNVKIKT